MTFYPLVLDRRGGPAQPYPDLCVPLTSENHCPQSPTTPTHSPTPLPAPTDPLASKIRGREAKINMNNPSTFCTTLRPCQTPSRICLPAPPCHLTPQHHSLTTTPQPHHSTTTAGTTPPHVPGVTEIRAGGSHDTFQSRSEGTSWSFFTYLVARLVHLLLPGSHGGAVVCPRASTH